MDHTSTVYVTDPFEHLFAEQKNGLHGELSLTIVVQVFDARPKHFKDHRSIAVHRSVPTTRLASVVRCRATELAGAYQYIFGMPLPSIER